MGRRVGLAANLAVVAAAALLLSACGSDTSDGRTAAVATSKPVASPHPSASDGPPPTFLPDGPAAAVLPYFDTVNRAVVAGDADAGGTRFVDALVAAGFDRSTIQVTADTTTIGDRADSIQFAVLVAGECLIGQYGPESGGYHGAVRPALGTGGCLVGRTRPVD